MIGQRLKDIKLQKWVSEINNDTRKDANQSNKMKPSGYSKRQTITNVKITYQVTNTRLKITLTKPAATKQPQIRDKSYNSVVKGNH